MSDPFLGELRLMAFQQAPVGWAQCNGQLLPINQNQALFSLLGTMYGGNGQTTFALPDLRDRVPMGKTVDSNAHTQGETGGEQAHTLTISELAPHTHSIMAKAATAQAVGGNLPGNGTKVLAQGIAAVAGIPAVNIFGTGSPNVAMSPAAITSNGGSQPHQNMQPYLTLNYCIALQGIFPSQN